MAVVSWSAVFTICGQCEKFGISRGNKTSLLAVHKSGKCPDVMFRTM